MNNPLYPRMPPAEQQQSLQALLAGRDQAAGITGVVVQGGQGHRSSAWDAGSGRSRCRTDGKGWQVVNALGNSQVRARPRRPACNALAEGRTMQRARS